MTLSCFGFADEGPLYLGEIKSHTPHEIKLILEHAEKVYSQQQQYSEEPVVLVLHGEEANVFVKRNYSSFKSLVDKAAQLDAYKVIDVKICETWMKLNKVNRADLPAFVDTVPFGPAEEKRLIKQGYLYF